MLQHSDGFDSHITGAATLSAGDAGWTAQAGVTITAAGGKFAGKSLQRAAATLGYADFSHTGTLKGFAGYFKLPAFGGAAETALLSTQAGGSLLTLDNTGALKVYDGAAVLRITAAAAITLGTYAWIEVNFVSSSIVLRVDGAQIASYAGAYTALPSTLRLLGVAPANTPVTDVDDFIAWDADGSYFNTFGLSPRRIHLLRPTAAGASTQWTPASGANWAAVDSADWAGGVGVTASAAGQKDLYTMADLPVSPASINAVVVKTRALDTGDNLGKIAHVLRGADGAEISSAAVAAPRVTAAVVKSAFYRDPAGAAWTASVVNSLQVGQISSN